MPEPAEKPKRRWFQFHLSTAMVVMVVAGLLVGANMVEQLYGAPLDYSKDSGFGFPVRHGYWDQHWQHDMSVVRDWSFEWPGLLTDVAVALAILALIAWGFESLVLHWRFHFDFRTKLVLMIVASLSVWAIAVGQSVTDYQFLHVHGWPITFLINYHSEVTLSWVNFVFDIVYALAILAVVATISELLIRRKKRA